MRLGFASLTALFLSLTLTLSPMTHAQESNFSTDVFDLGVVVSDVEKAIEFYTNAVGMQKVGAFSVDAETATAAGLTANQKLDVTVMACSDGATAARLKLMAFPEAPGKPSDNSTIHAQLGFSYLTLKVKSVDAALARLEKAGVKPMGKGPAAIPGREPATYILLVHDPDGNIVEFVGPK
jgi:catechol 2,3-dioxygenase-like lactoylglutathione lyase family enzyme